MKLANLAKCVFVDCEEHLLVLFFRQETEHIVHVSHVSQSESDLPQEVSMLNGSWPLHLDLEAWLSYHG